MLQKYGLMRGQDQRNAKLKKVHLHLRRRNIFYEVKNLHTKWVNSPNQHMRNYPNFETIDFEIGSVKLVFQGLFLLVV